MAYKPIEERFWAKVEKTETCWFWMAGKTREGYGRLALSKRGGSTGQVMAHRFAYELLVAPIPIGFVLDHLCRNPPCVNPVHLEVVTMRENTMRGIGFAARNSRMTHCIHGHPLLIRDDDFYLYHGKRHCKRCTKAQYAERTAAKREGRPARLMQELAAAGLLQ